MLVFLKAIEIIIAVAVVVLSFALPLHLFDYNLTNLNSFNSLVMSIIIISFIVFLAGEYTDGDKVSKSRSILKILLCGVAIAFIIMALAFFLEDFHFLVV